MGDYVKIRDFGVLLLLGSIWGASYLFIEVEWLLSHQLPSSVGGSLLLG